MHHPKNGICVPPSGQDILGLVRCPIPQVEHKVLDIEAFLGDLMHPV